jgi:tryptophan synthase alpha chain
MTYVNPVFAFGPDAFMANCRDAGIDAVIVPDLPFEEKGELKPYCEKHGVALISMIAPTTGARIAMIAREAEGFIYVVSSLGVTGVRREIVTDLSSWSRWSRRNATSPAPSVSASPRRSRRGGWRRLPTASSWAAPSSK